MTYRKTAILLIGLFTAILTVSPVSSEPFDWIMASIAKAGSLDNGQGHTWEFRKTESGKWFIDAPRGNVGEATSAGENKVKIDDFPGSWFANGGYIFYRNGEKCRLKSDHSSHQLNWKC